MGMDEGLFTARIPSASETITTFSLVTGGWKNLKVTGDQGDIKEETSDRGVMGQADAWKKKGGLEVSRSRGEEERRGGARVGPLNGFTDLMSMNMVRDNIPITTSVV
eukprot:763268-Hanusia_phi.AAC.4